MGYERSGAARARVDAAMSNPWLIAATSSSVAPQRCVKYFMTRQLLVMQYRPQVLRLDTAQAYTYVHRHTNISNLPTWSDRYLWILTRWLVIVLVGSIKGRRALTKVFCRCSNCNIRLTPRRQVGSRSAMVPKCLASLLPGRNVGEV